MSLVEELQAAATAEGFPVSGGVDIEPLLDQAPSVFSEHLNQFREWIQQGYQGEMDYMKRGEERRLDPRIVFPAAKSVFCVLLPYSAQPLGQEAGPRFARYLRGGDYHREIKTSLKRVMSRVEGSVKGKICVDTSAVLERSWAYLSGLGWIGKNKMLIHPQLGSYTFIGSVLLDQPLGVSPRPLPDYCGSCTKCLDRCPTGAFTASRQLDSRKCISYLTLEKRTAFDGHPPTGPWIAGCDICQEVCPFNSKAAKSVSTDFESWGTWDEAIEISEEAYQLKIKNSALNRVRYSQYRRNVLQAHSTSFQNGNHK